MISMSFVFLSDTSFAKNWKSKIALWSSTIAVVIFTRIRDQQVWSMSVLFNVTFRYGWWRFVLLMIPSPRLNAAFEAPNYEFRCEDICVENYTGKPVIAMIHQCFFFWVSPTIFSFQSHSLTSQGMCLEHRVTGPSADYDRTVAMALAGEMFMSRRLINGCRLAPHGTWSHGKDVWLVVWLPFSIFPFSWVYNHPNWRTHIFQRGGPTTNQMFI